MTIFLNSDKRINWGKIIEGLITAIFIAALVGAGNWFLAVRDLRRDFADLRKERKADMIDLKQHLGNVCDAFNSLAEVTWSHIHPKEPSPFPKLHMRVNPENKDSSNK